MKKKITYEDSVKMFVRSRRMGLRYGDGIIEKKYIKDKLLYEYEDRKTEYQHELEPKGTRENLENIIISQNGNAKKKIYFICCKYIEFINESNLGVKLEKLPPLIYSNLERQIELCRKMHSNFNSEKIGKEFLVSSRTIEEDLRKLRDGEISVMGQTLQVKYDSKYRGDIKMPSTAHPLFLVQNLTQIVAILNGLLYVYKSSSESGNDYEEYAENTAIDIWMQLSDYAKNRILNELVECLGLDKDWYDKVDKKANERKKILLKTNGNCNLFRNEKEASKNAYLYVLKNQHPCFIKYVDEEGNNQSLDVEKIYPGTDEDEKIIVCITSGGKVEIPFKSITDFICK